MTTGSKSSRTTFASGTVAVLSALALLLISPIANYTAAYGSAMEEGGSMTQSSGADSMVMDDKMKMRHILKGQISNVQLDSSGMPEWIQSGIWVLRANMGQDNDLQSAQLIARFAMVMPDGTAMHVHKIYGFKPAEFMTEQNDTIHVLEGTATVTMRDGPIADVPLTIKIFNKSVIGLWIGPDRVDGHFGSNPIYGIPSTGSRGIMAEMGSMMEGEHGGNMMGSMEQTLTKTNLAVTLPLTRGHLINGTALMDISDHSPSSLHI